MDVFDLFRLLVPSFPVLVGVAVLVVYVIGQNKAPTQPLAIHGRDGHYLPMGASGAPPSVWQARAFGDGDLFGNFGTVAIADGMISFTVEGGSAPWWSYPTRAVRGRHQGVFRLRRPTVTLWMPDGREIGLVVSHERINRWVNNNLKSMRQIREGHTFLSILAANGARILPS